MEFCLTHCQVLLRSDNGVKRLYIRIFIRVIARLKFNSLVFDRKEEFLNLIFMDPYIAV